MIFVTCVSGMQNELVGRNVPFFCGAQEKVIENKHVVFVPGALLIISAKKSGWCALCPLKIYHCTSCSFMVAGLNLF